MALAPPALGNIRLKWPAGSTLSWAPMYTAMGFRPKRMEPTPAFFCGSPQISFFSET
ncbi:hypothetical protein D3C80_2142040 [compost metagenome]